MLLSPVPEFDVDGVKVVFDCKGLKPSLLARVKLIRESSDLGSLDSST